MDDPLAQRWLRIKTLFNEAMDLDAAERAAFVQSRANGDEDLRQEVSRLLALDEEAGPFLEGAAIPGMPSLVAPDDWLVRAGELLANRYRIVEAIGRGGMGEVYEAFDETLGESIALKIAKPGLAPTPSVAARWRREAQLARKVSHRGVCRVHDVAVHHREGGELLFLTMERLRGDSLRTHLDRQDLSDAEAIDCVRQMCEALDAAHQGGVLHRDVKPDNIVVERGAHGARVVLTDFGLAREIVATAASSVTVQGFIAGTIGYLAPEVLRGEPASRAADLYALAAVARQLLTREGRRLSAPVAAVLGRALANEPSARFDSAAAFAGSLDKALLFRPSQSAWRKAGLAATVVVTVALSAAILRYYIQRTPHIRASSLVLATEMTNNTGEPDLDGAGEILRSQLMQSPHFEIVDSRQIQSTLALMGRDMNARVTPDVAREVAVREGAALVVYSTLTALGTEHVITVRLEELGATPRFARHTWTATFHAPSKQALFGSAHDAAVWIRRMAGETSVTLEQQDRAPAYTTTSSWEALRLYKQAGDLMAAGRSSDAVLLLNQALRLDPEFAMAQMRLADALISLRRDRQGFAAWEQAIALADRHQMTSREALRIRGQFYDDTGDLIKAEEAYRTFTLHYPNDYSAAFLLGAVLIELDRVSEAVAWLEKARAIRPTELSASVRLAWVYIDLGRSADVDEAIRHLESVGADDWATWMRSLAALSRGDLAVATSLIDRLQSSADPQWRSRSFTLKASYFSEAGRDTDAIREITTGIAFDEAQGFRDRMADKWLLLAELHRRLGKAEAVRDVETALETASNARRLAVAADLFRRMGQTASARSLLGRVATLANVTTTSAAQQRIRGELFLADHEGSKAVASFEDGFALARLSLDRLPFVRALVSVGAVDRAIRMLNVMADHPTRLYAGPEPQVPGPLRAGLSELLPILASRDAARAAQLQQKFAAFISLSTSPEIIRH